MAKKNNLLLLGGLALAAGLLSRNVSLGSVASSAGKTIVKGASNVVAAPAKVLVDKTIQALKDAPVPDIRIPTPNSLLRDCVLKDGSSEFCQIMAKAGKLPTAGEIAKQQAVQRVLNEVEAKKQQKLINNISIINGRPASIQSAGTFQDLFRK